AEGEEQEEQIPELDEAGIRDETREDEAAASAEAGRPAPAGAPTPVPDVWIDPAPRPFWEAAAQRQPGDEQADSSITPIPPQEIPAAAPASAGAPAEGDIPAEGDVPAEADMLAEDDIPAEGDTER